MKNLFLLLLQRFVVGLKAGKDEYVKTISKEDPRLTLHIFGWLKNVGSGLWNGLKGIGKSFFGGGGEVIIRGREETPSRPVLRVEEPDPGKDEDKKPNILLYVGIGVAAIVFVIVLAMVLRARK